MWLLSLVSALMSAIWWASRSRINLRTSVSVLLGPTVAMIISIRSEGEYPRRCVVDRGGLCDIANDVCVWHGD